MARLPQPGGDNGNWGTILNDFLRQSHSTDGTLKDDVVGTNQLQDNSVTNNIIAPGAVTKADVGLSDVDNTADSAKPVSTAQQSALDLKADTSALAAKLNTADLDTQTAAKINDNASATRDALSAAYGRAAASNLIAVEDAPDGDWTWTTHPLVGHIFVDQYGQFSTDLDPTTRKHVGGVTYYVDNVAGNDANDGLTAGTALQRIYTAAGKSDVGTIMVKANGAGTPYYRGRGFNGVTLTKNINIIGWNGTPEITTHDVLTYTLASGKTNTYQATRSSVSEVVDTLNGGDPSLAGDVYTYLTSIDDVEATPGSWFQSGSTLYVHAQDSRDLTVAADAASIWALLSVINFRNTGDYTSYLENLRFYGGIECIRAAGGSSAGGVATVYNVEAHVSNYRLTSGGNNIAINGCDAVLMNVESTRAGSDGFGYHVLNTKVPRIVEINCRATDCGHSSDDQCSSIHDGGKIIRIQGSYRDAAGATIADVNDGTETWNLGCVAEGSETGYNWKLGNDGGTPRGWYHACVGRDGHWSLYAHGTAVAKVRGSRMERSNVTPAAY